MADTTITQNTIDEIAAYLEKISSRLKMLEDDATKLDETVLSFAKTKEILAKKSTESVSQLKKDVLDVKTKTLETQKIIISMIGNLKGVVKRDEFEKLERKIDAWSPEKLVSRREAQRIIENA